MSPSPPLPSPESANDFQICSGVMGSGTVLDSARLRFLLARRLEVAVQNVHADVVGKHGDSEVALWRSATIGGIPLDRWVVSGRASLDASQRTEIARSVKNAGYEILGGEGATTYAVALAKRIHPVCDRVRPGTGAAGQLVAGGPSALPAWQACPHLVAVRVEYRLTRPSLHPSALVNPRAG
jgi:hypothetical protein